MGIPISFYKKFHNSRFGIHEIRHYSFHIITSYLRDKLLLRGQKYISKF